MVSANLTNMRLGEANANVLCNLHDAGGTSGTSDTSGTSGTSNRLKTLKRLIMPRIRQV